MRALEKALHGEAGLQTTTGTEIEVITYRSAYFPGSSPLTALTFSPGCLRLEFGQEFKQDSDHSITVTAKDNTEKIRAINISTKRKLIDKYTDVERKTTSLCPPSKPLAMQDS